MNEPTMLEFGSLGGSWLALAFFSLIFGALGWAASREVRRHSDQYALPGRAIGFAMFAGPLTAVYVSMLSGFYHAEVTADTIRVRYLLPGVTADIPTPSVSARIVPAYRDRVRLVITSANRSYESTPWRRADVEASLQRLKESLSRPNR